MFETPFLLRDESEGGASESLATNQEIDTNPIPEVWICEFYDGKPIYPKGVDPKQVILFIGNDGKWRGTINTAVAEEREKWRGAGH